MNNNNNNNTVFKIVEVRSNTGEGHTVGEVETGIQVGYLNMLRDKGLIPDNIHSIALNKVIKGVIG